MSTELHHLPAGHPDNPKPWAICGAHTRSEDARGDYCLRPAGAGTRHRGSGRCKLHGGASLVGPDQPTYTSGLGAKRYQEELRRLFGEVKDTGNPLDLYPELQVQQHMLSLALTRLAEGKSLGQPRNKKKTVGHGSDSVSVDNTTSVEVGVGGGTGLDVEGYPADITRTEFLEFSNISSAPPPAVTGIWVQQSDMDVVMEYAEKIAKTATQIIASRNQTALTKAEVMFVLGIMKEAINRFVPKENREAFVRYLMENVPVKDVSETSQDS